MNSNRLQRTALRAAADVCPDAVTGSSGYERGSDDETLEAPGAEGTAQNAAPGDNRERSADPESAGQRRNGETRREIPA